jgi:hypothetical protein
VPTLAEFAKWLSVQDVRERLGYSRQGIRNLGADQKIRGVKTRAGWLFDPERVEEFAKKHGIKKGEAES